MVYGPPMIPTRTILAFALVPALAAVGCLGVVIEHTPLPDDDDSAGSAGMVTTFVGSPGGAGLDDGVGNDAMFYHPYGIALLGSRMTMADGWGQTMRIFDPATAEVVTVAGQPGEPGYVDSADGAPQFDYPCGMEMGPDGLLYVADRKNGRIRVVDLDTGEVASLADQHGIVEAVEPYDVTFDGDGRLYFTDLSACQLRRVELDSGFSEVLVGTPDDCRSLDGYGPEARIGEPRGLAYHPDGRVYFTDRVGENVRVLDLATGIVSTAFGSEGNGGPGFVDGAGTDARLHKPTGLFVHGDTLYVADSDNDAIRAADLLHGQMTTLAGIGVNGNADGPGLQASFSWPVDLVVGGDGDLYVVDPGGHCLRKVDLDDDQHTVTTVAGAVGNSGHADGVGGNVRMSEPRGLARGDGRTVWIVDTFNLAMRTLDLDTAEVATVAGTPETYGHDDGVGDAAHFMTPSAGAWLDGKLYIVGTESHTVRVLDAATAEVSTLVGAPVQAGYADGIGGQARLFLPRDIVVGSDGALYVLETGNRAIRRVDPETAEVTTVLRPDDPLNPLAGPEGMAADGRGTLYVADYATCILASVDEITGEAHTLAGESFDCTEDDGADARFRHPTGLDVDPVTGLVYIASTEGRTVRIYDPADGTVSTLTGNPDRMAPLDGTLDEATFSTPVDILVVDDTLLVLDRYSAHVRRVELPDSL